MPPRRRAIISLVGPSSTSGNGDASSFVMAVASWPMAVCAGGVDECPPAPFTRSCSDRKPFSEAPTSATVPLVPTIEPGTMAPPSSRTSAGPPGPPRPPRPLDAALDQRLLEGARPTAAHFLVVPEGKVDGAPGPEAATQGALHP